MPGCENGSWHLVSAADDDAFDQIMSLLAGGQR